MYSSPLNAEEFMERLTAITEANLTNAQFGVSELAREMGMSRSNLHLRVKKLTKKSVSQFINQVRLEKAMEILKQGTLTISETAFDCGFQSVSYFSKCFNDKFGFPPGKVGNQIEPANTSALPTADEQRKKKWLFSAVVALLISILLLFVAQISHLRPLQNTEKEPAIKNIAVLPMHFEGSDSMKLIAGGFRELLFNSLMDIENLRIRSETSVEQYRENIKPLKEIAGELNVDYIIEMKGFQKGNEPWLQVNLADAVSDAYLLRESYPLDVYEENFLTLQNHITSKIIKNTSTDISIREKKILEERLTDNPAALNYYLQGLQHLAISGQMESFRHWNESKEEVFRAKEKLTKAISLDSSFIEVYVQLANIYINKLHFTAKQRELKYAYLDSGLVLAEKAFPLYEPISEDRNYLWSLSLIGNYYYYKGDIERSKTIYEERKKIPFKKDKGYYQSSFYEEVMYANFYGVIENFFDYLATIEDNEVIRPIIYILLFIIHLFTQAFLMLQKSIRKNAWPVQMTHWNITET